MASSVVKKTLSEAAAGNAAFNGLGIAYVGDGTCEGVRGSTMPFGYQTWIVFIEMEIPSESSNNEEKQNKTQLNDAVNAAAGGSVKGELISAGFNCTGAVLAGLASAAGVIAAPVTGGGSVVASVVTWTAGVAAAYQCGNSVGRVFNALFDPDSNAYLDHHSWFQLVDNTMEVISIATSLHGGSSAIGRLIRLRQSSGKSYLELVKGLGRQERKSLARELARYDGVQSNNAFKRLVRSGRLPKIFSNKQISMSVVENFLGVVESALTLGKAGNDKIIKVYFAES
ncbi:MAG: hypothetical protein KA479_09590 [Saprospiraceae bacterium]|nr:hypothetical protein [Saprospiraceae bacterium]